MYCHFWAMYISRTFCVLAFDAFSIYQYTKGFRWLVALEFCAMVNFYLRYGEDFFVIHWRDHSFPFDMMVVRIAAWGLVALIYIVKHIKQIRRIKYAAR